MMYRRHYNAIAAALRSGRMDETQIYQIAFALEVNNRPFQRSIFIEKALHGLTQEQRSHKYKLEVIRTYRRNQCSPSSS